MRPAPADFRSMDVEARACGAAPAHAVLLDLGISSFQLDRSGRGFSFQREEPLDMRLDARQPMTAAELVGRTPEPELARIIHEYGEEPAARRIARRLVQVRARTPISTTRRARRPGRLRDPAAPAIAPDPSRDPDVPGHPDCGQRRAGEPRGRPSEGRRSPGARRAVRRDRLSLPRGPPRQAAPSGGSPTPAGGRSTRKPLRPSDDEVHSNPRARSARFRVLERGS